jgi:uncharacterized PurR-regulated membrane protein YhhQ (DUF165 family)
MTTTSKLWWRKLVVSVAIPSIVSTACGILSLVFGRESLALWASLALVIILAEFLYMLPMTVRYFALKRYYAAKQLEEKKRKSLA